MMDRRLALVLPWLGQMTDQQVAERLSFEHGLTVDNALIAQWRRAKGIPAFKKIASSREIDPAQADDHKRIAAAYRRLGSVNRVCKALHVDACRVRLALEHLGMVPSRDARSGTAGRDSTGPG